MDTGVARSWWYPAAGEWGAVLVGGRLRHLEPAPAARRV